MLQPDAPKLDTPWVSGIRPPTSTGPWQERVQSILLYRFVDQPARGKTAEAEEGLGIPSCAYWYVCRCDPMYGFVVFLWSEDRSIPLEAGDGAVAPFDVGGVWHGHIRLSPDLDSAGRKNFVARHSRPLPEWLSEFRSYIATNYDTTADYVRGQVPKVGVRGIVYDSNEPPAWTWEARLFKSAYRRQIRIRHVFWSAPDRREFENWLETASDIDVRIASELLELISRVTIELPAREIVADEVERYLVRMVGDE